MTEIVTSKIITSKETIRSYQNMFIENTIFKKNPNRKWTWETNATIRNEIHFLLTDKIRTIKDVNLLNDTECSEQRLS